MKQQIPLIFPLPLMRDTAQAIKNFQAIREFYSGIGELSFTEDKMLMLWASTTVATSELEKQADVNNDDSLREFVQVTRARLAEEEKLFFDNPFLSAIGNRSSGVVNVQKFANRLALGIFGGLSLLVPMLIMVLYPTTITHLVTTIVSVMLVAISLSLAMGKSGSKDIFTAVAAYTAVLVVFVGTSNNMDEEISTFTVTDIVATSVLGGIVAMLAAWFGVAHIFFAKRTARKQRLADSGFDPIFRFLEPIVS